MLPRKKRTRWKSSTSSSVQGSPIARLSSTTRQRYPYAEQLNSAPDNPKPYQELISRIFVPQRDLNAAKDIARTGTERGADPLALYLALGQAARTMGNREEEKAAYHHILTLQPYSFEAHSQLGYLYLQERNFGQAALSWRKALEANPNSAWAFYQLGLAEEGRYRFFDAERAYAKAVELAPDNASFHQGYEAFRRKVAANAKTPITH